MNFDAKQCETYVRMLVAHDEVERALLVLDNVPAYYRDYLPHNLKILKAQIISSLCTPHAYLATELDADVTEEKADSVLNDTLRGNILKGEVKRMNEKNAVPHIVDMGPGEYFVPIGLKRAGLQFTYKPIAFDAKAQIAALPLISEHLRDQAMPNQPQIFLALEVIEHLANVKDIVIECARHCGGGFPERIHLSTPCYTYDNTHTDWAKPCGLPHLRAYTPKEFYKAAMELFPDYVWQMGDGQILSLRGMRADKVDEKPIF